MPELVSITSNAPNSKALLLFLVQVQVSYCTRSHIPIAILLLLLLDDFLKMQAIGKKIKSCSRFCCMLFSIYGQTLVISVFSDKLDYTCFQLGIFLVSDYMNDFRMYSKYL